MKNMNTSFGRRLLIVATLALVFMGLSARHRHGLSRPLRGQGQRGALHQLEREIGALWPEAGGPGAFPWQWLVDAKAGSGPARFDSQYWRANVDPSERYVMSVVNSTQYRLNACYDILPLILILF